MPSDIQVTCGSMVGENHQSPASTETPDNLYVTKISYNLIQNLFRETSKQFASYSYNLKIKVVTDS